MIRYRRVLLPCGGFSCPALMYTNAHEVATRSEMLTSQNPSSVGKGAGDTENTKMQRRCTRVGFSQATRAARRLCCK
ncbi:uncharacterized protein SCHCODRAFT_02625282 [Schizophyllum commune H4-8]|uniref:uncharacterized protein n=1 Tax=Schizophyllum commune (strain H4-8 / FGSC 9210) TaxID=578458 RepID=UPI00215F7137|nr:uncharacterized protein SCHCODRAFT_02625282 [Schizophyllum commune H4-8]KAI5892092.1 hypothetical protein SCHCODRAFT_02625282 [Schizophyllum commune H4-8]